MFDDDEESLTNAKSERSSHAMNRRNFVGALAATTGAASAGLLLGPESASAQTRAARGGVKPADVVVTGIEVHIVKVNARGNWVLVRTMTNAGVTGLGDASHGGSDADTVYGGEDTDFAQLVAAAGLDLGWVGAARAFHQWHPVSRPPIEHVDDIVRNAAIYRARWGVTPMLGWLEAFEERGLARHTGEGRWLSIG